MATQDQALFDALTPADIGIAAAVLDGCAGLGPDETTDQLAFVLEVEAGFPADQAGDIAYHIVHDRKRLL